MFSSYQIGDTVRVISSRNDKIRSKTGEVIAPVENSKLLVVEVMGEGDFLIHPDNLGRQKADPDARNKAELQRKVRKFETQDGDKRRGKGAPSQETQS